MRCEPDRETSGKVRAEIPALKVRQTFPRDWIFRPLQGDRREDDIPDVSRLVSIFWPIHGLKSDFSDFVLLSFAAPLAKHSAIHIEINQELRRELLRPR